MTTLAGLTLASTIPLAGLGSDITLDSLPQGTDITTNNVTASKHGLCPKLPSDATKYLDGSGAYTVPTGSGSTFALIADQLLVSTQATFDTNTILGGNIPSTSKHLQLLLQLRGSAAAAGINAYLRFNNDSTSTHYVYEQWYAGGPDTATSNLFGSKTETGIEPSAGTLPAASATAGLFAALDMTIYDYNGTTANKMCSILYTGAATTGKVWVISTAGMFVSTAALTRLQVVPSSGSWDTGSRFTLYGLG